MNLKPSHRAVAASLTLVLAAALSACTSSEASTENPNYTTEPSDTFPVTVEHQFGETTVDAEPQRVVVVGLTEQDILLELGVTPVATTEWYGEQPYAVWPWAVDLLGDAEPEVLATTDGLEQETYDKLAEIAPTVASVEGSEPYFSSWQEQTRVVAAAVGRSAEGEDLIDGVETAYAEAAAAHPEFAGLTATFSQGAAWEGNLWVYPEGLNTDFLTDLGFTITPGLEEHAPEEGVQAQISAENTGLLEADVVVFATEEPDAIDGLLDFGTLSTLPAVKENRAIYTDGELAGAIYFLTPLSQKHVLEELLPRLESAVAGEAPRSTEG